MLHFIAITNCIMAIIALTETYISVQRVKSGKAHVIFIRELTHIMDRNEINRLLGTHDGNFIYNVSMDKIRRIRRPTVILDDPYLVALCLIGNLYALDNSASMWSTWIVIITMLYMITNFVFILRQVRKYWNQISEELM